MLPCVSMRTRVGSALAPYLGPTYSPGVSRAKYQPSASADPLYSATDVRNWESWSDVSVKSTSTETIFTAPARLFARTVCNWWVVSRHGGHQVAMKSSRINDRL